MAEFQPIVLMLVIVAAVGGAVYRDLMRKDMEIRKIEALERIAAALEKRS